MVILGNKACTYPSALLTLVQLTAFAYSLTASAVDIQQTVLQNGVYTFDSEDDVDGICLRARQDWCEGMGQRANDPFWGRHVSAVCTNENKSKCVCDADVEYPMIIHNEGGSEVNKAFKKIADDYACSAGTAITKLKYEVTFNTGWIISTVFEGYNRATGGQGSCHSQVYALTADTHTGHIYTLKEALKEDQEAAIRKNIVSYVGSYFLEYRIDEPSQYVQARMLGLDQSLSKDLWEHGFYIRDRQLFIDLNNYVLGCSEGPSFAVPIPRQYINVEILKLIR